LSTLGSFAEVPWLQPFPDHLLDEVAPSEEQPEAVVVARETIELTYIALIQLLPPRQRAALILRDVLGWSAAETAAVLDASVAAANAASYLRAPGDTEYRAFKFDVIRVQDGLIAEVTTFNADLFEAFGLPLTL
jgi:predicted RNA polymerase sigma factor